MPLTRAEMRDAIRRDFNIIPPIDAGTGIAGAQPDYRPHPSNAFLNQKLTDALAYLSAKVNYSVNTDYEISVPVTTDNGAQGFDLWAPRDGMGIATIDDVRQVVFDDGVNTYPLLPRNYLEMNRGYVQWQSMQPARPRWFWIEGYTLFLLPGSSLGGTLHCIVGDGMTNYINDASYIEQLPQTYHTGVRYIADMLIAASQPDDAEMNAFYAKYQPMAVEWIDQIGQWYNQASMMEQTTLAFKSNRRSVRR